LEEKEVVDGGSNPLCSSALLSLFQ